MSSDKYGVPMDRPCVKVHTFDVHGVCQDCGYACDHDSGEWAEFPGEPRRFACESCGVDLTDRLREYNV
jgi:ribosomal protein L37E